MPHSLAVISCPYCNLRCRYCKVVHASMEGLKKLDKKVLKTFENSGQYYFDVLEKIGEDVKHFDKIELWGGEPLMRNLDFMYDFIREFANRSPVFADIEFSTNLCSAHVLENLKNLIEFLYTIPGDRKFTIFMQVSVDGLESDKTRGEGNLKRVIDNLNTLFENNGFLRVDDKRVGIYFGVRSTVDSGIWHKWTDRVENMNQFLFMDGIADSYHKNVISKDVFTANLQYGTGRLAYSEPWTKEDGLIYADVLRTALQLRKENDQKPFLKHIVPSYYVTFLDNIRRTIYRPSATFRCNFCNFGKTRLSVLPDDSFNLCTTDFYDWFQDEDHQEYVDPIGFHEKHEVMQDHVTRAMFCRSIEEYKRFVAELQLFKRDDAVSILRGFTTTARFLAKLGQIDSKYSSNDIKELSCNFRIMGNIVPIHCFQDQWSIVGSLNVKSNAPYKLCLNGAIDVLKEEALLYGKEVEM